MQKYFVALGLMMAMLSSACFTVDNPFTGLPPGPWRAVLELENQPIRSNPKGEPTPELMNVQFEEVTDGELPFTFDVVYDSDSSFHIEIHNGEETIVTGPIDFGRRRDRAKDSIRIDFPVFDTYVTALYEENVLEGYWVVNYRDNYRIPFTAFYGNDHRFTKLRKEPFMDVSGKWEVIFNGEPGEDPYPAIAEFTQDGNELRGTFRTETGDYRYLEGTIQANKIYLSVFDGAHAFLFEAKINEDSTLVGSFRSGKHYRTTWDAKRNPNAQLKDPNALTSYTADSPVFDIAFPNTAGDTIRLSDAAFADKVKLVQIMGTWCPNCKDETKFLQSYLAKNAPADLAVLSIAFERYRETDRNMEALRRFEDKFEIDWPVLLGGYYNKGEASKTLPMLSKILSYPTLLYVDRQNRVRAIHTGFNGPATSKYEEFVTDFKTKVSSLLAETGD